MKNTQQDRFEKKLLRFINELDKGWKKYKGHESTLEDYFHYRDSLFKKYGFTEAEWEKACRLVRSWTSSENGLKKTKRYERKKELRDRIKDITKSDNADNVNGEMEF